MTGAARDEDEILTIDRLVDHVSTVPAIAGEHIDLFVREKVSRAIVEGAGGRAREGSVVLMVHGGYFPSTLAFDVAYRDYSWMTCLARAGFDVFCMDMTGYGRSGRPLMDDPRNLDPAQQQLLVPRNLSVTVTPPHPFQLVTSDSETDDILAVVDFIRRVRGVERVSLIGWSGGGIRTGTFTVRHPGKVDRLIIHASSNYSRENPASPPSLPVPGAPMTLQTRRVGIDQRWIGTADPDFIEPGMPELIWNLNREHDPLGATWGPGGLRAPTRTYWGWNAASAAQIQVPVLLMVGELDNLLESNTKLFGDLGSSSKAYLEISRASHFAIWERQRHVLHRMSVEWLETTTLLSEISGFFRADPDGRVVRSNQP